MATSRTSSSNAAGSIEIINRDFPRGPFHSVMFDFDGTLSLLRRNWQNVMIPMMVEILAATGSGEAAVQLHDEVEEFVMRLNGRQTIFQMMHLVDEIRRRGGQADDPLVYKHRYHARLWEQVSRRIAAVRTGRVSPDDMLVPGSRPLLAHLKRLGLGLYVASGTDLNFVRSELAVLELLEFFEPNVFGALDDYTRFSKAMVVESIVRTAGAAGAGLVGFGDGFVEIEEVKKVGGLAIGVASDENARRGVDGWKRERLIRAGADVIIGDYSQQESLLELLGL